MRMEPPAEAESELVGVPPYMRMEPLPMVRIPLVTEPLPTVKDEPLRYEEVCAFVTEPDQ
jgi:hypothetical protein